MEKETKSTNKGFKIVVVLLLVVLFAAVTIMGFFLIKGDNNVEAISQIFSKEEEKHTIGLEEFVVNLRADGNRRSYLRIDIALMFNNAKKEEMIEENTNRIRDIIIDQLRRETADQMLDVERSSELKAEMVGKINEELGEEIIKDVYFTDMVIQ